MDLDQLLYHMHPRCYITYTLAVISRACTLASPSVLPQQSSEELTLKAKSVLSLMDKIPEEAESLTVLVGGVQFLQKPIVAFVRLDQVSLFFA